MTGVCFIIIVANFLYLSYRYLTALIKVQQTVVTTNPLYIIPAMILPVLWWIWSTREDFWNFYNRKNLTLRFVIINDLMIMAQAVWTMMFNTAVIRICMIPVKRNMNKGMILNLCRIALGGVTFLIVFALYCLAEKIMQAEEMKDKINSFRYQHIVDTRKNKEALYDLNIMKNMETGNEVTFKENDRFVHTFIDGASGTGKTSSTITPATINDLDRKMENKIHRQALIQKMIKEKRAFVSMPPYGSEVNEYCVVPFEGHENELKQIRKKYPDCGMTIMAPNNSLMADIIKLTAARGEKVNIIDPANIYEEENVKTKGLNPFFVPIGLEPQERQIQISNKAQTFAEVLMAVSEINGTGDQYFRDINTSVTTNIAIMCMLRANLNGRQTDITEIQACINDFGKLKAIVADIQRCLRMTVVIHEIESPRKKDARADKKDMAEMQAEEVSTTDDMIFDEVTDIRDIPRQYLDAGMTIYEYSEMLKSEAQSYYEPIHFVRQELLGSGYEKMFDQARGLRNLINKLLLDPRIKKVFSANEKNFIDWDKALAENEITLINTALEFGPQGSTALGLFIMLDMKTAIMRRPINTRSNHFLTIDEASQYMHPMFEDMFALYRQYRVACTIAMQSLSQMEKTPITRYLRGVIMGAGIHIVFGRISPEEMKVYEAMAGMSNQEVVQTSINSNSEFDDNYSVSKGQRVTMQQANVLDGFKIRQRDFQEVSVFMIDNGRVRNGFVAKVSFPKPSDYADRKVSYVDFSKYVTSPAKKEWEVKARSEREQKRHTTSGYETGIYNTTIAKKEQFESTLPPIKERDEIKKPPISAAADEQKRSKIGRADKYMAQMEDTEIFDTMTLQAVNKEREERQKKAQEFTEQFQKKQSKGKILRMDKQEFAEEENETWVGFNEKETPNESPKQNPLEFDFNDILNNKPRHDPSPEPDIYDLDDDELDDVERSLDMQIREDE